MFLRPFIAAALGAAALLGAVAGAQPPRAGQGTLKVGDTAPDFTVMDVEGKVTTRLSDLQGKPVVLIFGSCT